MKFIIILAITFVHISVKISAQTDTSQTDIFNMSLEDLMNVNITVASKKALSIKESPGIITVVTEEEIVQSGARDLIDVLRLVPGVSFSLDVQGVTGIGMRGNWGHEGKILLQIDGQEMNELAYSTLQFGNHFNIDQIKRIEIIRGPGSSIYGGFAELGVINIITKSAEEINGFSIKGTYGQMEKAYARRNINISFGKKIKNLEVSVLGLIGEGNRSDQVFTDIYGSTYDMTDGGVLQNPTNLNIGINYKNLKTRFIYDNYKANTISLFDAMTEKPYDLNFNSLLAEIKYDLKINKKLTITPKINFKKQNPWLVFDTLAYPFELHCQRSNANITSSYDLNNNINILVGGEYLFDQSTLFDENTFFNDTNKFNYNNSSAFAQLLLKNKIVNITIGGRVDKNSELEAAYSPRIGLTKVINNLHFKLLYSQAFRAPGIENMNLAYALTDTGYVNIAPAIRPEITNVIEFETGYKLSEKMFLTANFFNIIIKDPIIYFYDSNTEAEGYYNATQSGTRGVEIEYKIRDKWGYANLNYSYYSAKSLNKVSDYSVEGNEHILLSSPQHKVTLNSSFKINKNFSINPSCVFFSKRYTYDQISDNGTPDDDSDDFSVLTEKAPVVLANIFLNYNNLFFKGLNIGIGAFDLLNQKTYLFQAYNGWHSPYPATSREIILKLSYNFNYEN